MSSNIGTRRGRGIEQRVIELVQEQEKIFIQGLKPVDVESTSPMGGLGGEGQDSPNQGGGAFLPLAGGVMGGPIGFSPILLEIVSNELIVDETHGFAPRIIINGEGGDVNDIIERIEGGNNNFPGRMLSIQGTTGETFTFKHLFNGGSLGDIRTPNGVDFILNGEDNVTLIYDAINDEWTFMDGGLFNIGDVPDGTAENDHLEWDNTGKAWIAQQFLQFQTSALLPAVGDIRFKNNTINLAFRNFANTGDLEIKYEVNDFLDITENNNGIVKLRIRSQHAVNPDNTLDFIVGSGAGGLITIQSNLDFSLDVGASSIVSVKSTGISLNDLNIEDVTEIRGRDDATPFKIVFDQAEDADTFISDDTATADRINVTAGGVTFFSWLHDGTRPTAGIVTGTDGILTISDGQLNMLARAVPPDADLANDEMTVYGDTATDPLRMLFKRKTVAGIVSTGTFVYSPMDFDLLMANSNLDIGSTGTPLDRLFARKTIFVSGGALETGEVMIRNNAGDMEFNVPLNTDLYRFKWIGANDVLITFDGTNTEIQVDDVNVGLQLTLQPVATNPAINGIIRHITGGDVKVFSGGALRNFSDIGSGGIPHNDGNGVTDIIQNTADSTKKIRYNLSPVLASAIKTFSFVGGGTATYTFQSAGGLIAAIDLAQTWSQLQTFNVDIVVDDRIIAGASSLNFIEFLAGGIEIEVGVGDVLRFTVGTNAFTFNGTVMDINDASIREINELSFSNPSLKITTSASGLTIDTLANEFVRFTPGTTLEVDMDDFFLRIRNTSTTSPPQLVLHHNDSTPVANARVGSILFQGEDSASNQQTYGFIEVESDVVTSGSERGRMTLQVVTGFTGSLVTGITIEGDASSGILLGFRSALPQAAQAWTDATGVRRTISTGDSLAQVVDALGTLVGDLEGMGLLG